MRVVRVAKPAPLTRALSLAALGEDQEFKTDNCAAVLAALIIERYLHCSAASSKRTANGSGDGFSARLRPAGRVERS